MSDEGSEPVPPEVEVDYSKFNEDSVPQEEREIKQSHPGRPDLDYDDTPVGPAPGSEIVENNNGDEDN